MLEYSAIEMNKAWPLSQEEINVCTATVLPPVRAQQVVSIGLLKRIERVSLLGWEEWKRLHREGDVGAENAERCTWGPQGHTQSQWFTRRIPRTQHRVVPMAMIYYSEGLQNKISKERRSRGWIPDETRHKVPRIPSQKNDTGCT